MLTIHEGDHKGMKFEVATSKYLDSICEITEQAKAQLRRIGIDQWQKGYPSREIWEEDIEIGRSYILTDEGKVLGAFATRRFRMLPTMRSTGNGLQTERMHPCTASASRMRARGRALQEGSLRMAVRRQGNQAFLLCV